MRLTCPNCDAVYEVPRDAIPAEGRDVQCTNCGHSWFQAHPEADVPKSPAPALTADARRILEEEAERELATRAEERGRARRPKPAPVPVARDPDEEDIEDELDRYVGDYSDDEDDEGEAAPAALPVPSRRARRGRELLPDIEDVDGSLKQASERRGGRRVDVDAEDDRDGGGRAFRLGFGLVVLAALALVAVYIFAGAIAAAVPALAPALEGYVAAVDGLRASLDRVTADAAERLTGWVDEVAGAPEAEDAAEIVVEEVPAETPVETELGPDVDPEVEVVVEPEG